MSLQIVQRPTSPNAAYTRLLYAISGSPQLTQPQFQYVMDVYESGSTNLIKRTRQTANPAETAIFDPSRIIQGELSDDYSWKISSLTPFNSSSKAFTIKFGVQYANSISSSVTVYPDILEDTIEVFRGVVEPNDGYYNWPSSSKAVLSNMPSTMSMQFDDYGTISVYNNSVQYISQSFYLNNILIEEKNYSLTDNFTSIPITSLSTWDYVDVEVSSSIGKQNYRYEVSNDDCREKVRFAFINKQGTWDYYNNFNPVRQGIDITRQQYTAPRVDYSSITSTYDITRRGRTVNNSSTDDSFSVDTDWLTKTNANWLEELIESPSVYIQRNGEFIPIIINNSNYTSKTSVGRQKLFKYTLNFTPSNQPFGTWIPEYVPSVQSSIFDPTLGGEITPYFWYDFTDTGTMITTSSGTELFAIQSKGTNTGYLSKGNSTLYPKYNDVRYSPATIHNGYVEFNNNPLGKHSAMARFYDSASNSPAEYSLTGSGGADDLIFEYDTPSTTIYFTKPIWNKFTAEFFNGEQSAVINYKHPSDATGSYAEEIGFLDIWTTGSLLLESASVIKNTFDHYSSNSGSTYTTGGLTYQLFKSESVFMYENLYNPPSIYNTEREYISYNYDGTAGDWQSTYINYNYDVNNSLTVGREPNGQNYTTSSVLFQSGGAFVQAEYLTVGTRSNHRTDQGNAREGLPFQISHFLMYNGNLTDSQIQNVINSYKASVATTASLEINTSTN